MRIRKFNESEESLDNEIDAVYIRQCFADLIDSGVATAEEMENGSYEKWVVISISQFETDRIISGVRDRIFHPIELISKNNSLKRYIDTQNKNNERLQEVNLALERLADEYPNYKISVEKESSIFIYISI